MARRFYVVWAGRRTGIFTDWPTTQQAVHNYPGARFKSFPTREEAEMAFAAGAKPAEKPAGKQSDKAGSRRRAATRLWGYDVVIFCDGACDPNPGNAGSGIAVYRYGRLSDLWYGLYDPKGTNNTAELNALYHALQMAETEIGWGNTVQVCSDSTYSIKCIRNWAPKWEKRGWRRWGGEIKNLEIIQACYAIYQRIKDKLDLSHVPGHAGNEGNELADRMAMLAVKRKQKNFELLDYTEDISKLLAMPRG